MTPLSFLTSQLHATRLSRILFKAAISCLIYPGLAMLVASAQTPAGNLRGRVVDANGAALPGTTITIRNLSTGFERVIAADGGGNFSFGGSRNDRFKIIAAADGFASETKIIEDGGASEIEFKLAPSGVSDRITVISGSRQEELRESLNTKVDVIGRSRIRDTGYESVAEVLQELPGVLTRRGTASGNSGSGGEQIQGIDSRQVLVLFEGQPVIGARGIKSGVINLDRQSIANLESIEVVKGASSALYGSDAIGGVINQISRAPKGPVEINLTSAAGSQGRADYRGDLGFGGEKFSAFFSGERHKQNPFDLTPTTYDTTGAGFGRSDGFVKLKYKISPNFAVSGWAKSYWNTARGRAPGELGNQESFVDDDSQNYNLQGDWTINERVTTQARGYLSRFDEIGKSILFTPTAQYPDGRIPDSNLFERFGKVDGSVNAILGGRQLLQAGAEWTTDRYRGFNRLADDSGDQMDTSSFFAQDKISLGNRLTATVGGRFDHNSIFGNAFSPKAGFNLRVTDQFRARFSYGRGFRAPDLGQLFYRFLNPTNLYQVIGNPNLRPEKAHSLQFGGEFTSRNRRARLGLNLFYNDIQNLIDSVSLGFIASPQQLQAIAEQEGIDLTRFQPVLGRLLFFYKNIAEARTYGFELDGDIVLSRGFSVGGAYTNLTARDVETKRPLTGRHKHQGNIRLAWESNQRIGFRWNLRGTFYSKWINALGTATSPADVVGSGFSLWDFYGAKRIYHGLEFFGAVDNFTDNRDPNTGRLGATGTPLPIYRAELGRTFRVGMRLTWAGDRN
jgi:outer membrane receptor for ferrienterochelin and colicins